MGVYRSGVQVFLLESRLRYEKNPWVNRPELVEALDGSGPGSYARMHPVKCWTLWGGFSTRGVLAGGCTGLLALYCHMAFHGSSAFQAPANSVGEQRSRITRVT